MTIKRHSPDVGQFGQAVFAQWGFHQSVSWMGTIHYSGLAPLTGEDPASVVCVGAGDMREQLVHVLDSLDKYLAADGLDRTRLLSWTMYVTDTSQFFPVLPVLADWMGEHRPAATLVQVAGLAHPDQMIEITAFAASAEPLPTS